MAIQKNVWAPNVETWPRVSTPTIAQIVKSSMSTRRKLFLSLLFSSSASAVVVSRLESDAATGSPFRRVDGNLPRLYHAHAGGASRQAPSSAVLPARVEHAEGQLARQPGGIA